MTAKNKVTRASEHARAIDEETQALLSSVKNRNSRAIGWFIVSWTILFILSLVGLYYQNHLASQNKQHIDCIIKDLSTPQQPGKTKYIDYRSVLSSDCNIKFSS